MLSTVPKARLMEHPQWEQILSKAPILQSIGNTPLIDVSKQAGARPGVRVLAKFEGVNPGGSVKDRPALFMAMSALIEGKLGGGKVLLDSTSGNTGIAYAMIGAALDFPVELCLPENASFERKKLMEAYGARIHYTDPLEGSEGSRWVAEAIFKKNPEKYFLPDQYNNPNNPRAHIETTGPEIWRQTEGTVTHFLAGIGTSGTLMGTGRYLKAQNPAVQVYAVEPDHPMHGLEGLKHMASSAVPGIYDNSWLDGIINIPTEEGYHQAVSMAKQGILIGASGGAAMAAAVRMARQIDEGVIVIVFPDGGGRYLSTNLFDGEA